MKDDLFVAHLHSRQFDAEIKARMEHCYSINWITHKIMKFLCMWAYRVCGLQMRVGGKGSTTVYDCIAAPSSSLTIIYPDNAAVRECTSCTHP